MGKAIDPSDHVEAALAGPGRRDHRAHRLADRAPHGAQALRAGRSGAKARARLQQSEYYDDLMLLNELDRRGRVRARRSCELDEALEFLRELAGRGFEPVRRGNGMMQRGIGRRLASGTAQPDGG